MAKKISLTYARALALIMTSESTKNNMSPSADSAPKFLAKAGPLFCGNSIILHWYWFAIWTELSVLLSEITITSTSAYYYHIIWIWRRCTRWDLVILKTLIRRSRMKDRGILLQKPLIGTLGIWIWHTKKI